MTVEPLRVLLVVDRPMVPAWIAEMAYELDRADWAETTFLLCPSRVERTPDPRTLHRLVAVYQCWDRRHGSASDPLAPVPIPASTAWRDTTMVKRGSEHDPEVALDMRGGRLKGALDTDAKFGYWSFAHGDGRTARNGRPALLDAVLRGPGPCEIVLWCRIRSEEREIPVARSVSPTHPVSLYRQREAVLWKSARLTIRTLRHLAVERSLQRLVEIAGPAEKEPPPTATRSVLSVAGRLAARLAMHAVETRGVARLMTDQWFVAIRPRPAYPAPEREPLPHTATMRGARPIATKHGVSLADPCLLEEDGRTWLFAEQSDSADGDGYLVAAELRADGVLGSWHEVLRRPHHVSYPYVFRHDDQIYLLPETSASRSVELYHSVALPDRWERIATLLRGFPALDPTLTVHNGRFWLWVAYAEPGSWTSDELLLYHSDRLDGGWTPHPLNPVVSHAGRARPAGKPFHHQGRLIRPGQDCIHGYGTRIMLHHVEVMTITEYRETVIGTIEPAWRSGIRRTHTYGRARRWEAIDGRHVGCRLHSRWVEG